MPTHDEEPAWPSDDSDVPENAESAATDEAAAEPEAKPEPDGGETAHLPLPKVALPGQATVWVPKPPVTERPEAAKADAPEKAAAEEPPKEPEKPKPAQAESDQERTAFLPAIKAAEEAPPEKPKPAQPTAAEPTAAQAKPAQAKPEDAQERTAFLPAIKPPKEAAPKQEQAKPEQPEERTAFLPAIQVPREQSRPPQQQRWRQGNSDQVTAPQQVQPPQRPVPPQQRPIPPAGAQFAQPMRIEPSGEVHPAEAPQPAEPPPPPPEQPVKRKRRGLLVGAVALVLVIVVGVALALPPVSNRLGLPWAPNFPKADTPEPAAVTLALQPPSAQAPTPTSAGISAALAGPAADPALGTLAGIVIDPATGATLWNHNSTQLLTPASATKLLTTSAALLKLDHGLQIPTKVVQGSSPDTAVIVAGGDVTLSALPDGQDSVLPGAAHLDDLVQQVKQASGGTIRRVQIDLSLFSGPLTGPGWAGNDAPSTYAAPIQPAMLDAGRPNPKVDEVMRSADPAGTLLQTFAQRLGATAAGQTTAPQDAKVLGEVRSAPLTELVDNLLQISDNTLAEAVGRQTAIASGAPATFAGVAQTTLNVLAQNGFDVSGVTLNDGSGLSTLNKVSPRLLAQLITVAAAPDDKDPRTAKLRPLLEGLPVAGGSGTLAGRYEDPDSSAGKGWVRAKTGTLSGVNTLAGVVLDKDGRVLVFAFMSNGSDITAARPALDALAATLRGCGCG